MQTALNIVGAFLGLIFTCSFVACFALKGTEKAKAIACTLVTMVLCAFVGGLQKRFDPTEETTASKQATASEVTTHEAKPRVATAKKNNVEHVVTRDDQLRKIKNIATARLVEYIQEHLENPRSFKLASIEYTWVTLDGMLRDQESIVATCHFTANVDGKRQSMVAIAGFSTKGKLLYASLGE